MKRTLLLAWAVLLSVIAGVQTAWAQTVTLHMAGNEKYVCDISQLDSITFNDTNAEPEEDEYIYVKVYEDGTTSNGSIFSAIDDKNFYVDYIKYSVKEGHLVVSGYDKVGIKSINGAVKIVSKIIYKGITYCVLEIGNRAFYNCKDLTSVIIGNGVTDIRDIAFADCTGLTSIIIPNSVTSIGGDSFRDCTGLTSITIGSGVTSIEDCAFSGCINLTSVHITDLTAWCNIHNESNPLRYAHHLYLNSKEIKDLVIPDGVNSIYNYAFEGCTGLISVIIPNSVTSIGYYAFYDCSSLTTVKIKRRTPIQISGYTFTNRENATLYVPVGCKAAYQAANCWKEFKSIIEFSE